MGRTLYRAFLACVFLALAALALLPYGESSVPAVLLLLIALGTMDRLQEADPLRRNFPVLGRVHGALEALRPLLDRYLGPGREPPFGLALSELVRARSEGRPGLVSFGVEADAIAPGQLGVGHTAAPLDPAVIPTRVEVGGPDCSLPYCASLLNVSALSFGALSNAALRGLGEGARIGRFYLNTGEGGLAPVFRETGADLVRQLGTAYFGCRTASGEFCPERFGERACLESVRMIEVKLSQGAKPGHGGILLAGKVTREVAEVCGIPEGVASMCPAAHRAFADPLSLLRFLARLRALSGGKPVGFKLCVGRRRDVFALCKAMCETRILPDFISVDGAEGGAGAAPAEFATHVGAPLAEGLWLVDNALRGIGVRHHVRLIASGRIATGFDMLHALALGADLCAAARSFMLALGCIQALRCDSNTCPTGIATQDPRLTYGLVSREKRDRVARYQGATLEAFRELLAAMGLRSACELSPAHLFRRDANGRSVPLDVNFPSIAPGSLLKPPLPEIFAGDFAGATPHHFGPAYDPGVVSAAPQVRRA